MANTTTYINQLVVPSGSGTDTITANLVDSVSGYTKNTGTVTSVGVQNATNGGLTVSGSPVTNSGTITIGHSNVLTNAQTTQAVYPIKIDKNGHISAYGSAVTISDTKVTNTLATTTKYYVTGTTSDSTNTGTQSFDSGIYATTTAGQLNATTYKVNEKVTLQWNSTDSSLDFIF